MGFKRERKIVSYALVMAIKHKFLKGLLIVMVLALIPVSAISAQKITPGASCKSVNQKSVYMNKTYTCIKSGKKLVWNKGVAVRKPAPVAISTPTPTPSATPSPTPTPSATPSPTPTPTPVVWRDPLQGTPCAVEYATMPNQIFELTCLKDSVGNPGSTDNRLFWFQNNPPTGGVPTPTPTPTVKPWTPPTAPTSFGDVVAQADGIAYWAWKKAAQKIESSASKLGVMEIAISPNGVPDNPVPLVALNLVSRLSANYEEPKKVVIIYAGEKDIEWGQKQIDEFCAGQVCGYDVSGEAKKACNVPVTPCRGGVALRNNRTNIPLIYITASEWGKTERTHTSGTLEAHEYFHTIQDILLAKSSTDRVPRWLTEGSATWVQRASVYSSDFSKYEIERNLEINGILSRGKPTAAWIEKFLDPDYTTGWDKWNGNEYDPGAIYDVGAQATEVLVAIGGPDKFLDLFKITGSGKSFTQAFESIYGISWRDGVKIIANAIVAQQK